MSTGGTFSNQVGDKLIRWAYSASLMGIGFNISAKSKRGQLPTVLKCSAGPVIMYVCYYVRPKDSLQRQIGDTFINLTV